MIERLRFRSKVVLLMALALAALVVVTAVTVVLNRHADAELFEVQNRYLPLLELDRDLKALFISIPRTFEAAVAAAEEENLREADRLRDHFVARLTEGRDVVTANQASPAALLREFDEYYQEARAVTIRMMRGITGEEDLARVERMRSRQQTFQLHLDAATTPSRTAMAAAFASARAAHWRAINVDIAVALAALLAMGMIAFRITRSTVSSLQEVKAGVERLARGDFGTEIVVRSQDEFGDLAREANQTAGRLRDYREASERNDWVKTGLGGLTAEIAGELGPQELGQKALSYLGRYLDAPVGAIYATGERGVLRLLATHAVAQPEQIPQSFAPGEGLVGQAAVDAELRVMSHVAESHLAVRSAIMNAPAGHLAVVPLPHERRTLGVMELAGLTPFSDQRIELLRAARGALGIAFAVAESRQRQQELLERTQRQAEELQMQQEELQQTNEELAEQTRALEAERRSVMQKNQELQTTQGLLQEKAEEVARASRYKSEFLANMSHELRTPLNGIMVLSQMLAENAGENLSDKQVEFARVIHKSGEELLGLINQVLDLAKVESGRQELFFESVGLAELATYAREMFSPLALRKGLTLEVSLSPDVPATVRTDRTRVDQIVKNLLSNALKFTEKGRVAVSISPVPRSAVPPELSEAGPLVAVAVSDSGVGIPADKQQLIFEAFAQAEGGTSRKYGGTGLGLAIAKQLAGRLGGDLRVQSEVGKGSIFTLFLPLQPPAAAELARPEPAPRTPRPVSTVVPSDDRDALRPGDPCLLIIDDDATFGDVMLRMVRESGFRALWAMDGESGLALAERHRPSGIILDVGLPDMDGWSVMERLKARPSTSMIPVHFISAAEGAERARTMGAIGFLSKPGNPEQIRSAIHELERDAGVSLRKVLVVEDDPNLRMALQSLLSSRDTPVEAVASSDEAFQSLRRESFGCVVLDLGLPDKQQGFDLVARLRADESTAQLPIIVHTGFPLSAEEVRLLEGDNSTVVVLKGERSPERLTEEVRLFVHRVRRGLPAQRQRMTERLYGQDPALVGKKVLIVDDDMRNLYSLSAVLRARGITAEVASDGLSALQRLTAQPEVHAVLMDIMMPGMDGYETIRRIRADPRFVSLPILALTAKAMPGDRQKCIDAGATDYLSKPVDVAALFSALRVWLGPATLS